MEVEEEHGMRPRSIGCANYKAFKSPVTLEVRPLTLLFGKNNSGKTALLRLIRLLLHALSSEAPKNGFPLEVNGLSFGRVFRDLIHGGAPHGAAAFTVQLEAEDSGRLELSAKVQNVQVARPRPGEPSESSVISEWELRSPEPRSLVWEPALNALRSYRGEGAVAFRGLLPEPRGPWAFLEPWRTQVDEFLEHVTHLGPVRATARPTYEATAPRPLGLAGEEAISWLDKELLDQVGAWFEAHLDGWRLGLDMAGSAFHCTLSRGAVTVNLSDAGQGMQQVFPVVVQQLLRRGETRPFMDLVEQPELHLHAAAQAPLADLFLDTAKEGVGTVVVETHSENLLLRVRRRIAEGLAPNLVALYWVDEQPEGYSTVRRIHIDSQGEVDDWPEGVFSEGYEEVKALRRAARRRQAGEP